MHRDDLISTETNPDPSSELLEFFKALADAGRLRIVGLLATEPHSVEALAHKLGLSASTTSHHLARLSRLGLVSARTSGHYSIYSLDVAALEGRARRLLGRGNLERLAVAAPPEGDTVSEAKVLRTFLDDQGRILKFPSTQSKFLVVLRHTLHAFEVGRRYSEPEVNAIFSKFSDDTARLRRAMVEHGLMAREGGGGAYWRL